MSTGAACFHCGQPVGAPGRHLAVVEGVPRELCCAGCQAVTEAILGAGLEAFYRNRGESRSAGGPPVVADHLDIYDRPEVQSAFVESAGDATVATTLLLEGITCAACTWLNEQHLQRLPGVLAADVNYATRRARVRWDPARVRLSDILRAIQDIGYQAAPADSAMAERLSQRARRAALWRLFVAAFGMMQVMMYAWPAYVAGEGEMGADIAALLRWASLLLTLPVVVYSAAPFFRGAWRDLRLRRLGMDVPVALGVGAAFLGSCHATWVGRGEVYFDSVTMFVFLLLASRWFEAVSRARAGEALRHLTRALPARALRLTRHPASRDTETVPAAALQPGDHVLVRSGDAFPADGVIVEGDTRVDESVLTGESLPAARREGAAVTGGTVNAAHPVVVQVERVGADTRFGAIVRLAEAAQHDRPPLVRVADGHAGAFVLAVLLVAVAATLAWTWIDPQRVLPVVVAVLVVTCPCALSLATPAALAVATGALARCGLVVTRSRAIETAARATHVVLDKTGTLTEGVFALVAVRALRGDADHALRVAAGLGAGSDHPVDRALRAAAGAQLPRASAMRHEPGGGLEGEVEGRCWRLGRRGWVEGLCGPLRVAGAADDGTEAWLVDAEGPVACFTLGDRLRQGARELVAALRGLGLEVVLASGDRPEAAGAVAARCGIGTWHGDCSPEDKHALVARLQSAGAVVCMVGDGVNDAPVLARADVSVAMGSGAVLAQRTADLVLAAGPVTHVVRGLAHARRTLGVVRQNLAWAFAYNLVAVPLAAFGVLSPWAAGVGMAASSALVVANALRLWNVQVAVPPAAAAAAALAGRA